MQSSKRRKILHKNRNDSITSDEQNINSFQNKYNHHRKHKFKSSRRMLEERKRKKSKYNKKWQNLNYANLNHPKCASDYIGPERLTKHVGFLTKGKISNSISRLEKVMPDELRARANQDLHRVLKFANKDETVSPFCDEMSSINLSCTNLYDPVNISPEVPSPREPIKIQHDVFNSTLSKVSQFVQTSASLFLQESCPGSLQDELSVVEGTIKNKLYPAIARVNHQIFSNVSIEETLKTELLTIQRQYNANNTKTPSSSSNSDSQEVLVVTEEHFELNPVLTQPEDSAQVLRDNFELNPILTQERDASKKFENMFPEAESSHSSSSEESIEYLPHISDSNPEYALPQKTYQSPKFDQKSLSLIPHSLSSNGTPVWIPNVSPVKFVPNFPPTPKIYFRQKMF